MTQTEWVISELKRHHGDLDIEIVPVVTKGDRILDVTLSKVGGKGLFVSEVEACLQDGTADFAVHSLKDVPAELADGMVLGAMPRREDPRDVWISKSGCPLSDVPTASVIGTSSLRRMAQLQVYRPDVSFQSVRGNIDTRLRKLEAEGELAGIVLAAAGLHRMGWSDRVTEYISQEVCLPAVGQGILGIECREDDAEVRALLASLHDENTALAAKAERTLLHALNGGCQVPIAGYAEVLQDGRVWLRGLIATPDGTTLLQAEAVDSDATQAGLTVAGQLRNQGAIELLASVMNQAER